MRGRAVLGLVLLSLAVGGCASIRRTFDSVLASGGSPGTPTQEGSTADEMAASYRTQAGQHERDGQLRPALEAWTTALALAPDHEPSRVAIKRVRWQIDRELAERLKRGWQAVGRDAAAEARHEFVAALALEPSSRSAHEGLRAVATASATPSRPLAPTIRPAATPPPPARVISAGPERPGKAEPLCTAAKGHAAEGRDEDAYRAVSQLERLHPGYTDCAQLRGEVRQRLVRQRYQDGLQLFRDERLEEAIEKWRGVLELDAGHVHARRNIEQAQKMLRTLAAQPKR